MKMKVFIYKIFIFFILIHFILGMKLLYGQGKWIRTYGTSYQEIAKGAIEMANGEYLIMGEVYNLNNQTGSDLMIIKLGLSGDILWKKVYGADNADYANSLQATSDGGFIIAGEGYYLSNTTPQDFWVIKFDQNGNKQWSKTYGGSQRDYANSITQTYDGGYIVAGVTYTYGAGAGDFWIIKLNSNGNIQWNKTFGGFNEDIAYSIDQTTDGGYIVAGETFSYGAGGGDFLVIRLNASGNIVWQKTYGGSKEDAAFSIKETNDGGFIVTGYSFSFGQGDADILIIRLDSLGNPVWQKKYGGNKWDSANSIQQTADGGYIVAGRSSSFGSGSSDIFIIKLNSAGKIIWQKAYGGVGRDEAYSIRETTDGGYIIAGSTTSFGSGNYDAFILKISADGSVGSSCSVITNTNVMPITISASFSNTNTNISSPFESEGFAYENYIYHGMNSLVICEISCSVPTGLVNNAASDIDGCSYSGIQVSWNADPGNWGDNGQGQRYYDIIRNEVLIASDLPYGTTTFIDTNTSAGQTYLYKVKYKNGCGYYSITQGMEAIEYPRPPTEMNTFAYDKSAILDTGVHILWDAPYDWGDNNTNSSNRGFKVYRENIDISGMLPSNVLSYDDNTGTNNFYYAYHIDAYNGCGLYTSYTGVMAEDAVSAPGAVPDNDNYLGTPLTVSKSGSSNIILNWGVPSGICQTQDYGIYRGLLPFSGYNHAPVLCSTGGNNSAIISADSQSYYYLVVAQYGGREGSYGLDSANVQRPPSLSACLQQAVGDCENGTWAHIYGGSDNDLPNSIKQTSDGGFIVAGKTYSFDYNQPNAWVIKLDSLGGIQWQKTFDRGNYDEAMDVLQTDDNAYLVALTSNLLSNSSTSDIWLMKLNNTGEVSWQKIYHTPYSDKAFSIQKTSDGNFILVGNTEFSNYDPWILKLDSLGNVIWQKIYSNEYDDYLFSIRQTTDGGYIAAGISNISGYKLWVIKLDASGNVQWQRLYFTDGSFSFSSKAVIEQTSDGGYIVGTNPFFNYSYTDIWILKLDANGNVQWQKRYGEYNDDYFKDIKQTNDGEYILVGNTFSFSYGILKIWIIKLDSLGNIQWQKIYGNTTNDYAAYAIIQTADGGYVIAGSTSISGTQNSDILIFKINADGSMASSCFSISNTNISATSATLWTDYSYVNIPSFAYLIEDTNIIPVNTYASDNLMCPLP